MVDINDTTHDDNSTQHRRSKTGTLVPAGRSGWIDAIQSHQHSIETAVDSILTHAMDAGDILTKAKDELKATGGPRDRWGQFLEDCGLPVRTAEVYMQLAAGRAVIDAEMKEKPQRAAELSIRGALKLLSKKSTTPGKHKNRYSPEVLQKLSAEARAQLTADLKVTITSADVPAAVKAEIIQHAVTQEQLSADDIHLASLEKKFVNRVRSILKTKASEKNKIADLQAELATLDEVKLAPRMDREASIIYSAAKPSTASSIPSDLETTPKIKMH
jgi:hypothetical protein